MGDKKKGLRRKKHKNSKLGCPTCKRRRVKCTENLPQCTNCVKHGTRCEYLDYTDAQLDEFRRAKQDAANHVAHVGSYASQHSPVLDPAAAAALASLSLSSHGSLSSRGSRPSLPQSERAPSDAAALPTPVPHAKLLWLAPANHADPESGVTQDYDNLLAHDHGLIIYPVYLILSTPESPAQPVAPLPMALPHAVSGSWAFPPLHPHVLDYEANLFSTLAMLAPLISQGKANLLQIRGLYIDWLKFFTFKAYTLEIMFLCLTNLTTNYMITNVFSAPHAKTPRSAAQLRTLTNNLTMHLIQHYATVIRSLRLFLNRKSEPEMAASVSYILSLMSMYDPEATSNSTTCFRDGMFSVLSYTLHTSRKQGVPPPRLVPVHLQLVSNIARTVYLPAYKPWFLYEYEEMFERFGAVLNSISPLDITNHSTFLFITERFNDVLTFCREINRLHIPAITNSLNDIPFQMTVFFTIIRKWTSISPSRLLTSCASTDPLERVFNLFVKLFRKAVFAAIPQMKFCYMRDLDSPLMLDVFCNDDDTEVYNGLLSPRKLCITSEAYAQFWDELRTLTAYAVRVITFLEIRVAILYKSLVYNDRVRKLYPIDNISEWRNSITDIAATREEFKNRIGLVELHIEEFNNTYITPLHYPRIIDPELGDATHTELTSDGLPVDLNTLTSHGLLEGDSWPLPA